MLSNTISPLAAPQCALVVFRGRFSCAELKNTLQQGLNNAAKNPELTKDMASRQQAAERTGQQGRDAKNSLSDMLRNVMDRGREMLGMNQQRMVDSRLNNLSSQQSINTRVTPQNQLTQNNAAMLANIQASRMAQPQQVMQQSIAQNNMQMANIAREVARVDVSQQTRSESVSLQMRTEVAPQARTEPARNEQPQPNVVRDNPPSTTPQLDAKPAIAPTTDSKPSVNPTDNTPPTTVKPDPNKIPECCKKVAETATQVIGSGFKLTPEQEKRTFEQAANLSPRVQEAGAGAVANQHDNASALMSHLRASVPQPPQAQSR
jgi:hypothetical protein